MKRFCLISFLFLICNSFFSQEKLAFPGADGFGKYTSGGRGGFVYHVTNLNDAGEGSLRYGINLSGARTIVFDVSGTIELESRLAISNGDLTIAGQTAPGDGICIKNYEVYVGASNVIIRFLRFRLGTDRPEFGMTGEMTEEGPYIDRDAIWGRYQTNVILDHCSMSWSTDECGSFYNNTNFTMQWCLLGESLRGSIHPKGNHGYAGIWGGQGASFHHNLLAHHDSRMPRLCGIRFYEDISSQETEIVDIRNNVFYNWGSTNSGYAAEGGKYNFVNNYYKAGPATATKLKTRIFQPSAAASTDAFPGVYGFFYVNGNTMNGEENFDWKGIHIKNTNNNEMTEEAIKKTEAFSVPQSVTHSASESYEKVLGYVGASLSRDAIDARIVREVKNGEYTYKGSKLGGLGIIDATSDVGGYPKYVSLSAQTDTDQDGMPDEWEESQGLNPLVKDHNGYDLDTNYTNLEVYLNSIVEDVMNCSATINTDEKYGYSNTKDCSAIQSLFPIQIFPNQIVATNAKTISLFLPTGQKLAVVDSEILDLSSYDLGVYLANVEYKNGYFHRMKFIKK